MKRYLDELETCHGRLERIRAEGYLRRGATPPQVTSPLTYPLNAGLARAAEGMIVHSEWSRERFSNIAPGVPIAHINHHITARAAASETSSTQGNTAGSVNIASFGLITPDKGVERALRALAALRGDCDFHYTLVGPAGNFPELSQLIQRYGLEDRVSVTGHVSLSEFEQRITQTDIAINLRERPVGATSGSLCRIMAAGVPAIVSNVGAFAELPDSTVVKIDPDQYADPLLEAYLRELIENPRLRRQLGKNARHHVLANHNIENGAARYISFIRQVIQGRPRKHFVTDIADQLSQLGFHANDEALLRGLAEEVALLAPAVELPAKLPITPAAGGPATLPPSVAGENGNSAPAAVVTKAPGRLAKIDGLDYKRAAVEYPAMLDAERSHYLRTKPFYNLANKPVKHTGDGMDPETHRHFADFTNMAVALALPAGARILDVGCGSGWLSEYFARLGYDVTGLDISDDLIQMARERVERIPYNVDHETPLRCRFITHDVEAAPLEEQFDAVICYDSLHHFVDEHAVMRHLSAMLPRGGLLFILEGDKPEEGSATEEELVGVMREFATLESPFHPEYLRALIVEHGFKVIGDYVSANGLFERETVEDGRVAVDLAEINYLLCKKVVDGLGTAAGVPDSRAPGKLTARITTLDSFSAALVPDAEIPVLLRIENTGDTIWLTGPAQRKGAVMLGVMLLDDAGTVISERHGEPPLPRALAPGESFETLIKFRAPQAPGNYRLKVDLVAQHVAWFEHHGSEPLIIPLAVR